MKIAVTSDVLVRAVLRDDEILSFAAERLLKNADLIAVTIPAISEFVEALQRKHALEANAIANAVRSLVNAANVRADYTAISAGLAALGNGGTFDEGMIACEGQRLGANRFVSFDPESVERIERMMPHYR